MFPTAARRSLGGLIPPKIATPGAVVSRMSSHLIRLVSPRLYRLALYDSSLVYTDFCYSPLVPLPRELLVLSTSTPVSQKVLCQLRNDLVEYGVDTLKDKTQAGEFDWSTSPSTFPSPSHSHPSVHANVQIDEISDCGKMTHLTWNQCPTPRHHFCPLWYWLHDRLQ